MKLRDKELGPEVVLSDELIVKYGQRPNTGENQILGNLIGERFHSNQQNVGGPQPCANQYAPDLLDVVSVLLLSLDPPKTDLTIVQGYFICSEVRSGRTR